jgi:hypothetical protein
MKIISTHFLKEEKYEKRVERVNSTCWIKLFEDLFNNIPKLAQIMKNGYICCPYFVEGHPAAHKLKDNIDWLGLWFLRKLSQQAASSLKPKFIVFLNLRCFLIYY